MVFLSGFSAHQKLLLTKLSAHYILLRRGIQYILVPDGCSDGYLTGCLTSFPTGGLTRGPMEGLLGFGTGDLTVPLTEVRYQRCGADPHAGQEERFCNDLYFPYGKGGTQIPQGKHRDGFRKNIKSKKVE